MLLAAHRWRLLLRDRLVRGEFLRRYLCSVTRRLDKLAYGFAEPRQGPTCRKIDTPPARHDRNRKALDLIEPSLRWRSLLWQARCLSRPFCRQAVSFPSCHLSASRPTPRLSIAISGWRDMRSSPGRPARAVPRHNRCFYGVHARADKWVCRFQPLDEFSVRGTCTGDYRSSCSLGIYTSPIVFTSIGTQASFRGACLGMQWVVESVLLPWVDVLAKGTTAVSIVLLLLLVDPVLALSQQEH